MVTLVAVRTKPTYTIHIEPALFDRTMLTPAIKPRQICIFSDPTVFGIYGSKLAAVLQSSYHCPVESHLIESGETNKNLVSVAYAYNHLADLRFERGDLMVALGGGVIGDLAGFVAATYLRGVPYVQVPTTLLAQVDSSVGGKTGVDHPLGKNLIGAFYQPRAVWIDPHVLRTLPLNQRRAGLAEVVKYGVIADQAFFEFLENQVAVLRRDVIRDEDWPVWNEVIARCCQIKADVVASDEKEITGHRAILNFGHTFGHAFETVTRYSSLLHGEAVAAGMRAAGRMACALGLWSAQEVDRVEQLLDALELKVALPPLEPSAVLDAMRSDKKVRAGKLHMVLPQAIGKVCVTSDFKKEDVLTAMRSLAETKV